jgi:hypothetical protein
VPRDWHLERYPGKWLVIDMTTDEIAIASEGVVVQTVPLAGRR